MYNTAGQYSVSARMQNWTRIDMLLALYDQTILKVRKAAELYGSEQTAAFGQNMLDAQKCIFGLFSGLMPENDSVAYNVARLLHFSLEQLRQHKFNDALVVLESIRSGFETIREEASLLEKQGKIPPFTIETSLNQTA